LSNPLVHAKKLVVGVVGVTILVIGLVLLVMPGPGLIVIILGLGILATEFVWAQKLLKKTKDHYENTKQAVKTRMSKKTSNYKEK